MQVLFKGANWLGDAVMTLPALAGLKAMRPRTRITVLTKPAFADLYRGAPGVHETILHRRGNIKTWRATVRELRKKNFDVAILFPRSFSSALLVHRAHIPRRIGYAGQGRGLLLTDIPTPPPGTHRVNRFHHLLAPLGDPPPVRAPKLELLPDAREWAARELPGDDWIGINPGATYGAAKQWFPERFIELGKRLGRRGKLVVVGGPSETKLGTRISKALGAVNLAGRTSVSQLAAAIARCRLFITNDTGPMHVADAVGCPIAAVFGPTDWIETPPYGRRHKIVRHEIECSPCLKRTCPLGHHDCMKKLGVDDVYRACKELLR